MTRLPALLAAAAAAIAAPLPARAQSTSGLALNPLDPAPPGDALFAVPSPGAAGHLLLRAQGMLDHAVDPLLVDDGSGAAIVSAQTFLRAGASVALWDRVLVSAELPLAIIQRGDSPVVGGAEVRSPSGAQVGDLRIGGRARLVGAPGGPAQLGVGLHVYAPTGPTASYAGEGAARALPHGVVGGRIDGPVPIAWSAALGAMLRGSDNPDAITFGAGAAASLAGDLLQVGPELHGAAAIGGGTALSTPGVTVTSASSVNAELLLGVKLRPLPGLVIGAAAGPGLTPAIGTPAARAVALVAWSPEPERPPPPPPDRDGDGVPDPEDACPKTSGDPVGYAARPGCPGPDRDGDRVSDARDACPDVVGPSSRDPARSGCPLDRDGDRIPDALDTCPEEPGLPSDDAAARGCPPPPDTDGDGFVDALDACPIEPGVATENAGTRGCPPPTPTDRDGDEIPDADDGCPSERGGSSPDPNLNGCPPDVRVTDREIVIFEQIRFRSGGSGVRETIDPLSNNLLIQVRDVIDQHPEITRLEVQGHTDSLGDEKLNLELSQARAETVRDWLVEYGIPTDKLVAKGYGPEKPVASNRTAAGRQKNRRVQFVILSKAR